MMEINKESIRNHIYSIWNRNEYEHAVDYLHEFLSDYQGEDVAVLEVCYSLLKGSYCTLGRYEEAESALREGLHRLPQSLFLHRGLAIYLWEIVHDPEGALKIIDHYLNNVLDQTTSKEKESSKARIEALSLRGRLLNALGRTAEALGTLKTILPLLPPFNPIQGYLFDVDLLHGLVKAQIRDIALRDFINRITDTKFLLNGNGKEQFSEMKQYLNSEAYLS